MIKRWIEQFVGPRYHKVNCWYCGQDSYLLPGSGQTPRKWYCNICESTNIRDENGEIVDVQPTTNNQANRYYCVKTQLSSSSQQLCENCLAEERRIRENLNNYIPAENDARFNSRYNSAEEYERYLREKYRLCKDCQNKVDRFNLAQETRLPKRLENKAVNENNEKRLWRFSMLDPSQKSDILYFTSKCTWGITHIATGVIMLYGCRYPFRNTPLDVVAFLDNIYDKLWMFIRGDETKLAMLKSAVKEIFSKLLRGASCLVLNPGNEKECQMPSDYIVLYYILNVLSIFTLYWHPLVSREFENGDPQAKNYDIYKAGQVLLFIFRSIMPFLIRSISPTLLILLLSVYCIILTTTTFNVRVQGHPVLKRVGKQLNVESNSSTLSTPSNHSNFGTSLNDELKDAMTYKKESRINNDEFRIPRDDDVHRAAYDLNRLRL